ncbi:hypothetical protein QVD17_06100 [Tagetes erecta]|uniref:Uncharacterized protein n=1 Tax=Tagetes erecta TaxID=13708 RepID=A0AAD8LMT9_TARER|nr:hypothetical protein QVD17_06100 [Tagetes erecta]
MVKPEQRNNVHLCYRLKRKKTKLNTKIATRRRWSTLLGRWSTPRLTKNGFLGVLRSFLKIFEGGRRERVLG